MKKKQPTPLPTRPSATHFRCSGLLPVVALSLVVIHCLRVTVPIMSTVALRGIDVLQATPRLVTVRRSVGRGLMVDLSLCLTPRARSRRRATGKVRHVLVRWVDSTHGIHEGVEGYPALRVGRDGFHDFIVTHTVLPADGD